MENKVPRKKSGVSLCQDARGYRTNEGDRRSQQPYRGVMAEAIFVMTRNTYGGNIREVHKCHFTHQHVPSLKHTHT